MTLEQTIEELEQNIDKVLKEKEHLQAKLDKAVELINNHDIPYEEYLILKEQFLKDCKGE